MYLKLQTTSHLPSLLISFSCFISLYIAYHHLTLYRVYFIYCLSSLTVKFIRVGILSSLIYICILFYKYLS